MREHERGRYREGASKKRKEEPEEKKWMTKEGDEEMRRSGEKQDSEGERQRERKENIGCIQRGLSFTLAHTHVSCHSLPLLDFSKYTDDPVPVRKKGRK